MDERVLVPHPVRQHGPVVLVRHPGGPQFRLVEAGQPGADAEELVEVGELVQFLEVTGPVKVVEVVVHTQAGTPTQSPAGGQAMTPGPARDLPVFAHRGISDVRNRLKPAELDLR
ncbi:hypothetical protein AB0C76_20565 [Kitasatospora sp. NPDC048722]|uniref:hypothetical protein n=1 Tax=Kitasatospora sp. NPDC048722 TaxID=3155639 RepID=UPI0033E08991